MELNSKTVGRNIAKFRMMRDLRASDLAKGIGLKEAAYTKYERGETKVTVELVQKVATALNVDPISILAAAPDNFIESITNNASAQNGQQNAMEVKGDYVNSDPKQQELMMKLMEKLIDLLGKK
jgi:transcriptional regulator with XRE-family HTH domain